MTRRHLLPALLQTYWKLTLDPRDIAWVAPDLIIPGVSAGPPRPGVRVSVGNRDLYHVVFLPEDWHPKGTFPLIVEYPGNGAGPLTPHIPGSSRGGTPDDTKLGYGISGGRGFIWLSLPFVETGEKGFATTWWGDTRATLEYCRRTVPSVCAEFGGDSGRILLCGFSRSSIACNYIGLHDASIAEMWRAFVCHSHYDGVHRWPYSGSDRRSALERLKRLRGRPQFITHENSGDEAGRLCVPHRRPQYVGSVEETRRYLEATAVRGDFTFDTLPYPNHTDVWMLRPISLRTRLREWVRRVLS